MPPRIHASFASQIPASPIEVPGVGALLAAIAQRDTPVPGSAPVAPPAAPLAAPQTTSSAGGGSHGPTSLLLLTTLGMATLIGSRRIREPVLAPGQRHYRPPVSPG
jgi:hypothetical protein